MGVRSMTGFGTVSGPGFVLTAKSVNHRFLDLQVRVPAACDGLEAMLRGVVRGMVRRGHVEVLLQVEAVAGTVTVRRNDVLLEALVRAHREAAALHGIEAAPDLNALLRTPGVMTTEAAVVDLEAAAVESAAQELMERLNAARGAEGGTLAVEMRGSMDRLLGLTEEMAVARAGVREAHLERLRGRMAELLEGLEVNPERLLVEAALLAERSDVEEEVVRLRTHARRFQEMLEAGGDVGKPLDFLLQEMNREANTMVSKVNGAMGEQGLRLTDLGLAMKAEIERVKEQVQNVE